MRVDAKEKGDGVLENREKKSGVSVKGEG